MMRWLNFSIILLYLSILLSPPVKAVTQSRVDLVGSGLSFQNAIMPLAKHLPSQFASHSDTPDDGAVLTPDVVTVSSPGVTLLSAALPALHSSARLLAQPRAPPSLS
ncbi:hypothetical protein EOE67_01945 [Rheinheimera riviphila]|uniref:Uncharacterized protein n=1 Tax=Rheinheimera riviphila TaxID=1834037 RepID=A0A437R5G5_9GAMM|nr:hypothetical protein [Rheinheimera riviphila]RVU41975.1 hypothetical protein EOE67_01945 [Rheinheimera riviphila]